jgi:hypothetical protein
MPANFAGEAQFQKHLAALSEQHDKEKENFTPEPVDFQHRSRQSFYQPVVR